MNITNAQLLSFDIENFRKIEKLEHTLAGSVTLIGGPNANGKTAIIKAMQVAFQGKDALPATPVRKGADKSVITLKINTDTHGILTCVITDKPDGKHEIVVTSELGGVMPSPQTMLKSMVSPFSGDPIALAKLEGKDLVKGVMATCGLDFTDVNFRRQRAFDERKMANQDVTRLKGQLSGLPVVPEGTPDTEQSAESVNAELTAAMGHNNKLSELKAASDAAAFRLKSANEKIEGQREKIGSTEAEILALTSRLESEKKTLASFNEQLPAIEKAANAAADATASFVPIDVNPIQVKIANLSNMRITTS